VVPCQFSGDYRPDTDVLGSYTVERRLKMNFDEEWSEFVSRSRPGLFTEDKSLAYCFYLKGWMAGIKSVQNWTAKSELNDLPEASS
jgi:hypothetical protein